MPVSYTHLDVYKRQAKDPAEGGNMKATGIVRRIDDLGRIVIPKEIRRTLKMCIRDRCGGVCEDFIGVLWDTAAA